MSARVATVILASLGLVAQVAAQAANAEEQYYQVDYLTPPTDEVLEIGGMDFMPDGRLVLSTRRGQIWVVTNPLAEDPSQATFQLFAEGLNEGLGLKVVDGAIYVVQRGELSRLVDLDGDDVCDRVETISDAWGVSGNYHEFAFGLPQDADGNFYVGLNVSFFSPKWWHGKSTVPYRGWVLRIAPDGTTTPVACGFRSPCGLGRNAAGELFVTDNQGDWMASSPIFHLQQDAFYGHPASLDWTPEYLSAATKASDELPPPRATDRTPPAVWIPYDWSRSTGNLVPDLTDGKFGPFGEQLFVAELTNGLVLRTVLEKVRGQYQGACILFRQRIGSVCRVAFAPDGSLFTGFTNRGWGGLEPAHGIARVRWTGETPLEMHAIHLLQDGFEVSFTLPLASDVTLTPDDIDIAQYDYNYWWEYGSPEQDNEILTVERVEIAADRKSLRFHVAELTPAKVARVALRGVVAEGGVPLLHEEFAYTINQLPEGPLETSLVAKIVEPPPARDADNSGWLRLTWGDALDAWESEGWQLCDVQLDPDDQTKLVTEPGVNALTNTASESPSNFVSEAEFGDCELKLSFMLPDDGNSGVYLMGRYEVQLRDSEGKRDPGFGDCGGIYRGESWPGSPPQRNAFKRPGVWHDMTIRFRAPRFDEQGTKIMNARFERVSIDGMIVQEDTEVSEVTGGAIDKAEAARGPLMLQGDHGPVAYGAITIRPLDEPTADEGWEALLDDDGLTGWRQTGAAEWDYVDGTLIGSGPPSHLVSPAGDYSDIELKCRVKVSDGGESGIVLRAGVGADVVQGYEAQINSSFPAPEKTGSFLGFDAVKVHLIPADTWFDYRVRCQSEPEGVRLQAFVNGILVNDVLDPLESFAAAGHIAFEQHHLGSVVEIRDLFVRRLGQ